MLRWVRRYWDEEDIWLYFELDPDGWAQRQVELQGADQTPCTAASLTEWSRELDAGRIQQYQSTYGALADQPIGTEDLSEYQPVDPAEFERTWRAARHELDSR